MVNYKLGLISQMVFIMHFSFCRIFRQHLLHLSVKKGYLPLLHKETLIRLRETYVAQEAMQCCSPYHCRSVNFLIYYYLTTVWQINFLWVSAQQLRAQAITSTCKDEVVASCRFNFTKTYFASAFFPVPFITVAINLTYVVHY